MNNIKLTSDSIFFSNKKSNKIVVLFFLLPLFFCNTQTLNLKNGLSNNYLGARSSGLSKQELKTYLSNILYSLKDSVQINELNDLWQETEQYDYKKVTSHTEPDIRNISTMISIIRDRGFNIFQFDHGFGESLNAISSLPQISILPIIHFNNKNDIIDKKNNLQIYSKYDKNIRLHVIDSIVVNKNYVQIITKDGLSFGVKNNEQLDGIIFSANYKNYPNEYCQVKKLFFITSLSKFDIDGQLNEWYKSLPYTFTKPITITFKGIY